MFEGLVSWFIRSVLGEFVEEGYFSEENVSIGVWSGYVVLENLVLKKTIFDLIKIPVGLCHGVIGKFELRIPWSNLGIDPVIVVVDKVSMVMEPKFEWDPGARHTREQALKQAKLAAVEVFATNKTAVSDPFHQYREYARNWLVESLILKIINNIQIHVREIHIRYEDRESCPTEFCVGMTVESIHIHNKTDHSHLNKKMLQFEDVFNSQGENNFSFDAGSHVAGKSIEVNQFCVYWNPLTEDANEAPTKLGLSNSAIDICSCVYSSKSPQEMEYLLSKTITRRNNIVIDRPKHHYILHPMDISNGITFAFDVSNMNVKADLHVGISDMHITFEDNQFREILSLATNMSNFSQLEEYSSFRPSVSVHRDPKAWWRYCIFATIHQIRKAKPSVRWSDMVSRRRDKLVYIELWKSRLASGVTTTTKNATTPSNTPSPASVYVATDNNTPNPTIKLKKPLYIPDAQGETPGSTQSGGVIEIDQYSYQQTLRLYSNSMIGNAKGTVCFTQDRYNVLYDKLCNVGKLSKGEASRIHPFSADAMRLLFEMEEKLTFEDIVYFRTLAEKELANTLSQKNWLTGMVSWAFSIGGGSGGKAPSDGSSQGRNGRAGHDPKSASEDIQRKLIEALELDAKKKKATDGNHKKNVRIHHKQENTPMVRVFATVTRGSITLCLSTPHGNGGSTQGSAMRSSSYYVPNSLPFLAFALDKLNTGILMYEGGGLVKTYTSLQDFEAYETLTVDLNDENIPIESRYRRLVSRRTSSSSNDEDQFQSSFSVPGPPQNWAGSPSSSSGSSFSENTNINSPQISTMLIAKHRKIQIRAELGLDPFGALEEDVPEEATDNPSLQKFALPPLLHGCIEIAPPTYGYEMGVKTTLDELEVLISPSSFWVQSLTAFITWPEDLEYWSEMEIAVMNQFADWKSKFDAKIDHMMNNHMDIMIDMDINAPVIVLFESTDWSDVDKFTETMGVVGGVGAKTSKSPELGDVIIVDLGKIIISTERLAKAEHRKLLMESSSMTAGSSERGSLLNMSTLGSSHLYNVSARNSWGGSDAGSVKSYSTLATGYGGMQSRSKFRGPGSGVSSSVYVDSDGEDENDESKTEIGRYRDRGGAGSSNGGSFCYNTPLHESILYDVFHVNISSVEVCLVSEMDFWRKSWNLSSDYVTNGSPMPTDIGSNKDVSTHIAAVRLVEKFDVFMEIEVSALPYDTTLPPVKCSIDLPEINVQLSDNKITRLIRFSSAIAKNSQSVVEAGKAKVSKYEVAVERRKGATKAAVEEGDILSESRKTYGTSGVSSVVGGGVIIPPRYATESSVPSMPFKKRTRSGGSVFSGMSGSRIGDADEIYFDADEGDISMAADANDMSSLRNRRKALKDVSFTDYASARSRLSRKSRNSGHGDHTTMNDRIASLAGDVTLTDYNLHVPSDDDLMDSESDSDTSSDGSFVSFVSAADGGRLSGAASVVGGQSFSRNSSFGNDNGNKALQSSVEKEETLVQKATDGVKECLRVVQQDEKLCAKYMADIRIAEMDHTKDTLVANLKKELAKCEESVRLSKAAYVDALIHLENVQNRYVHKNMSASGIEQQENVILDFYQPHELQSRFVPYNKRYKPVFRMMPENKKKRHSRDRGGVGGNKELIHAVINFPVVNVIFSAANKNLPHVFVSRHATMAVTPNKNTNFSSNFIKRNANHFSRLKRNELFRRSGGGGISETKLIRIRVAAISMEARHRALDSQVKLIMREFDVVDLLASSLAEAAAAAAPVNSTASNVPTFDRIHNTGSAYGSISQNKNQIYLLSSESSANSMMVPQDMQLPSGTVDVLKIKYEVVFGKDDQGDQPTQKPERKGSDECDEYDDDYMEDDNVADANAAYKQLLCSRHKLRVSLGFIDCSFDQNTVSGLLDCVSSIVTAHKEVKVKHTNNSSAPEKGLVNGSKTTQTPMSDCNVRRSDSSCDNSAKDSASVNGGTQADESDAFTIFDFKFKLGGIGFALMKDQVPAVGVAIWGVKTNAYIGPHVALISTKLADCSVYHTSKPEPGAHSRVSSAAPKASRRTVIGRASDSRVSSLMVNFRVNLDPGDAMSMPAPSSLSGKIRSSPLQVVIIPELLEFISVEIFEGKVAKSLLKIRDSFSHMPQAHSATNHTPNMNVGSPNEESMFQATPRTAANTAKNATSSASTDNDPVNQNNKTSPADLIINSLCALCAGGHISADMGHVIFTVVNGLNADPIVIQRQHQALHQHQPFAPVGGGPLTMPLRNAGGAAVERYKFAELTLYTRAASAHFAWGDCCAFDGGLEALLCIHGIRLSINEFSIIESFDFFLNQTLQSTVPYSEECLTVISRPMRLLSSAHISSTSLYLPPPITKESIVPKQVQVSSSVSPIAIHCSDAIASAVGEWINQIVPPFRNTCEIADAFINRVKPEDPHDIKPVVVSPPVSLMQHITNLNCDVVCKFLAYEFKVSLDGEISAHVNSEGEFRPNSRPGSRNSSIPTPRGEGIGISPDNSDLGQSGIAMSRSGSFRLPRGKSGGSSSSDKSSMPPRHIPKSLIHSSAPRHYLSFRHVGTEIAVQMPVAGAVAPDSLSYATLKSKFSVHSMDFICVSGTKKSNFGLKRLLSTVQGGGDVFTDAISTGVALTTENIVSLTTASGKASDVCEISTTISGVHFYVVPEQIIDVAACSKSFVNSFLSAVNASSGDKTSLQDKIPTKQSTILFPSVGGKSHSQKHATVNPSSVPLPYNAASSALFSKRDGGSSSGIGGRDLSTSSPLRSGSQGTSSDAYMKSAYLFSDASFSIPMGIRILKLGFATQNTDLWMPYCHDNTANDVSSSESDLDQLVSALHVSVDVSCDGEYLGGDASSWGVVSEAEPILNLENADSTYEADDVFTSLSSPPVVGENDRASLRAPRSAVSTVLFPADVDDAEERLEDSLEKYYDGQNAVYKCGRNFLHVNTQFKNIVAEFAYIPHKAAFKFAPSVSVNPHMPETVPMCADVGVSRKLVSPFSVSMHHIVSLQATMLGDLVEACTHTPCALYEGNLTAVGSKGLHCVVENGLLSIQHSVNVCVKEDIELMVFLNMSPWMQLMQYNQPILDLVKHKQQTPAISVHNSSFAAATSSSVSNSSSYSTPLKNQTGLGAFDSVAKPNPVPAPELIKNESRKDISSVFDLFSTMKNISNASVAIDRFHLVLYVVNDAVTHEKPAKSSKSAGEDASLVQFSALLIPLSKIVLENKSTSVEYKCRNYLDSIAIHIAAVNKVIGVCEKISDANWLDKSRSNASANSIATTSSGNRKNSVAAEDGRQFVDQVSGGSSEDLSHLITVPDYAKSGLSSVGTFEISVYYVNQQLMLWEPIIEPFLVINRYHLPHGLGDNVQDAASLLADYRLKGSLIDPSISSPSCLLSSLSACMFSQHQQSVHVTLWVFEDEPRQRHGVVQFTSPHRASSPAVVRNMDSAFKVVTSDTEYEEGIVDIEAGDDASEKEVSMIPERDNSLHADILEKIGRLNAAPEKWKSLLCTIPCYQPRAGYQDISAASVYMHVASVVNLNITYPFVESMLAAVPPLVKHVNKMKGVGDNVTNISGGITAYPALWEFANKGNADDRKCAREEAVGYSSIPPTTICISQSFSIRNETGLVLEFGTGDVSSRPGCFDPLLATLSHVTLEVQLPVNELEQDDEEMFTASDAFTSKYSPLKRSSSSENAPISYFNIRDINLESHGYKLYRIPLTIENTDDDSGNFGTPTKNKLENSSKELMKIWNDAVVEHHAPSDILIVGKSVCSDCVKTLWLRSTMKLENNTREILKVELCTVQSSPMGLVTLVKVVWETVLKPLDIHYVPAQFCDLPGGQIMVYPIIGSRTLSNKLSSATLKAPPQLDKLHRFYHDATIAFKRNQAVDEKSRVVAIEKADEMFHQGEIVKDDIARALGAKPTVKAPSKPRLHDHFDPTNNQDVLRCKHSRKQHVDIVTYAHWMTFEGGAEYLRGAYPRDSLYLNVAINAVGVPSRSSNSSTSIPSRINSSEECAIRTVSFQAPVIFVNALGSKISLKVSSCTCVACQNRRHGSCIGADADAHRDIFTIQSGHSVHSMNYHAAEAIELQLQFVAIDWDDDSDSEPEDAIDEALGEVIVEPVRKKKLKWSSVVQIPGCDRNKAFSEETVDTLVCGVAYRNSSVLSVLIEVQDIGGVRTITAYTPYWIVTSSPLLVQFQHDVSSLQSKPLNGIDGLCGDQPYKDYRGIQNGTSKRSGYKSNYTTASASKRKKNSMGERQYKREKKMESIHRSMKMIRGYDGIKLGPEFPIRGLVDILPAPREKYRRQDCFLRNIDSDFFRLTGEYDESGKLRGGQLDTKKTGYDSEESRHYVIVHCGYTDGERKLSRLRLRAGHGTSWSAVFSPDVHYGNYSVTSTSLGSDFENLDRINIGKPAESLNHHYESIVEFSFGISTRQLEPPFHRTSMVTVVDRFSVVNKVDEYSLEIRQYNKGGGQSIFDAAYYALKRRGASRKSSGGESSAITTLKPNEESILWWNPTKLRLLQVRLKKDGWSWSGRFSIIPTSSSSNCVKEIPIRLKNENDSTVFFLMALVVQSGSRISVVFKGGKDVAPYKIENHTLTRFRVLQECNSLRRSEEAATRWSSDVDIDMRSGASDAGTVVLPYHACYYAWDEPVEKEALIIEYQKPSDRSNYSHTWKRLHVVGVLKNIGSSGGKSEEKSVISNKILNHSITFDKLQDIDVVGYMDSEDGSGLTEIDNSVQFTLRIIAEGPVRVLQIHENWGRKLTADTYQNIKESNNYMSRALSNVTAAHRGTAISTLFANSPTVSNKFDVSLIKDFFCSSSLLVYMRIDSIGVSIIDNTPQELLYISLHNAETIYSSISQSGLDSVKALDNAHGKSPRRDRNVTNTHMINMGDSVMLNVQHFQVDSQLRDTPFPCTFFPTTTNATAPLNVDSCTVHQGDISRMHSTLGSNSMLSSDSDGTSLSLCSEHTDDFANSNHSIHQSRRLKYRNRVAARRKKSSSYGHDNRLPLAKVYENMVRVCKTTNGDIRDTKQFIQLFLSLDDTYPSILFIKQCALAISPFDINLESSVLFKLKDLGMVCLAETRKMQKLLKEDANANLATKFQHKLKSGENVGAVVQRSRGRRRTESHINRTANHFFKSGDASKFNQFCTFGSKSMAIMPVGEYNFVEVNTVIQEGLTSQLGSRTTATSAHVSNKLYLGELQLSDIRFNMSLNPIKSTDTQSTMAFMNRFALGVLSVTKMDNCLFKMGKLKVSNLFANNDQLLSIVSDHYVREIIANVPSVLLSFEIFGNLYEFLKTMYRSLKDFIYMPYTGMFTSPVDFVHGLWRGTASLLRGTTASVLSVFGHITSVARISLINFGLVDTMLSSQNVAGSGYSLNSSYWYGSNSNSIDLTGSSRKQTKNSSWFSVSSSLGTPMIKTKTDSTINQFSASKRANSANKKDIPGLFLSPTARTPGQSTKSLPNDADILRVDDVEIASMIASASITSPLSTAVMQILSSYYSPQGNVVRPTGLLDGFIKGVLDGYFCALLNYKNDGVRGLLYSFFPIGFGLWGKCGYGVLSVIHNYCMNLSYQLLPQVRGVDKHRLIRVRPPRYFHSRSVYEGLKIYSRDENVGLEILSRVEQGKFKPEGYDCHALTAIRTSGNGLESKLSCSYTSDSSSSAYTALAGCSGTTENDIILSTSKRLIYLVYGENQYDMQWDVTFGNIASVEFSQESIESLLATGSGSIVSIAGRSVVDDENATTPGDVSVGEEDINDLLLSNSKRSKRGFGIKGMKISASFTSVSTTDSLDETVGTTSDTEPSLPPCLMLYHYSASTSTTASTTPYLQTSPATDTPMSVFGDFGNGKDDSGMYVRTPPNGAVGLGMMVKYVQFETHQQTADFLIHLAESNRRLNTGIEFKDKTIRYRTKYGRRKSVGNVSSYAVDSLSR